jgi:hypothetical protein
MRIILSATVAALVLVSCGSKPEAPAAASSAPPAPLSANVKRYPMHGKVLSVSTADKTAKIDADEIPGWMGAMAMDYPVRDAAELTKLTPNKEINATVFVDGDNFWVGEVKEPSPAPDKK